MADGLECTCTYKLAVTAVNSLTLVLLAAPCSLFHHFLCRLSKSIAEVATTAETHFCENFLNVRLNDHKMLGKENKEEDQIVENSLTETQGRFLSLV